MPKTAKETMTKAAFVRSLPETMPAKEVVAKGKDRGISLTESHVSAYRSIARAKKAGGKPGKPARRAGGKTNKSAFVRSLPEAMSLKEVVAKAKEQGITLSEKHVSAIRSLARASGAKKAGGVMPKRRGRPPGSKNKPRASLGAAAAGFESHLAELVLEHGVRPIQEALAAIRERLRRAVS
jgi:hypothetical protein